jgi:hypothetical protein
MLSNPRVYNWVPNSDTTAAGQPFVRGETLHSIMYARPHHLIAGDGHRIPFPYRILESDQYLHAQSCNVRLFVETDNQPYPGVDYVMEINLPGDPHRTLHEALAMTHEALGWTAPPNTQRWWNPIPIVAGIRAGAAVFLHSSPLDSESHWENHFHRSDREAVVRYDYMP